MRRNNRWLSLVTALVFMVAIAPDRQVWRPFAGAQTRFLSSPAFEAFYGGAAGPGKTDCLLMEALRQISQPRYNAVLFRQSYPQLEAADGLIARSERWYPALGGSYNAGKHVWTFPSGAHIYLRHLSQMSDLDDQQGAQYQFVGFDELGQFEEKLYLYLFSRCRTDEGSGLRCYIRSAGNPGGYIWVKRRFVTTGIANKVAYFARIKDKDTRVEKTHADAKSRTFIPATYRDNPMVTAEYLSNLRQLDEVTRLQLMEGDWDAEAGTGRVYPNWSSILNVTEEAEYDPNLGNVYWSIDDGYAVGEGPGTESYHPRVVLLSQVTPLGGLNVFAERYVTGESDYNQTIDAIIGNPDKELESWPYPLPVVAYVDSSAAMFRGALSLRGIPNAGATHAVIEGVRNLRRMVCDANQMRLLRVHPRCENLIEEMGSYLYDDRAQIPGGDRKPRKMNDHGPDALRYRAWPLRYGV
jgi:hypothetical protein